MAKPRCMPRTSVTAVHLAYLRIQAIIKAMQRRALVVDDESFVAALVENVLKSAGFEVCIAHSSAAASLALEGFDPDVAVLDISLGQGASGLDLAHVLSGAYPGVALLLLSRYPDLRTARVRPEDLPRHCLFLSKSAVADAAVLLDAVESALREKVPEQPVREHETGPLAGLTRVQLDVLHSVAQGYTNLEIARKRGCSTSAVEKVLGTIYQRLGLESAGVLHPRVEAVRIYTAAAILPDRPDSP